ncbi:hypothetical protein SB89_03135 [Corynebacterium glutamicum]|nr:hypothetical protein SB89_03135 [Corynebacterium glutamicum]OKX91152.1 hypothetical protein AUP72_08310 [Corynebacterium glutamicum]TWS34056.1 hypothetical protein AKJ21_11060 [Corynebacterium glutamicum]
MCGPFFTPVNLLVKDPSPGKWEMLKWNEHSHNGHKLARIFDQFWWKVQKMIENLHFQSCAGLEHTSFENSFPKLGT